MSQDARKLADAIKRDPRLNPEVGDILRKRGGFRHVLDVRLGVNENGVFVTSQSSRSGVEVVWRRERWRSWAKTATIARQRAKS